MKIKFNEKIIIKTWLNYFLWMTSIVSFLFLFFDLNKLIRLYLFCGLILFSFLVYLIIYLYYKNLKKIKLNINGNEVNITFGNIFNAPGNKVIAFNEYYDTIVDEEIINKQTINGQFIQKIGKDNIDKSLANNLDLEINGVLNNKKTKGKQQKYKLGQIHKMDNYFLLSFARFNEKNESELISNEYAICLLEMWKNLGIKYQGEEISLPLLGAGITRIRDNMQVSNQELLEIMLRTLYTSKVVFKKNAKINIILWPENKDFYNFARIKYMFKN